MCLCVRKCYSGLSERSVSASLVCADAQNGLVLFHFESKKNAIFKLNKMHN